MDKKTARGIAAYKKNISPANAKDTADEKSGGDWLARLAENDFGDEQPALEQEANPPAENSQAGDFKGAAAPLGRGVAQERYSALKRGGLPPPLKEPKFRRVAKFLILIGSERAAAVLENLDDAQIEEISREISTIRGISSEEAEAVLAEFDELLSGGYRYGGASRGGVDEARKLLYTALGPEKGEAILRRATNDNGASVFNFLEDFSGEQVMTLLRDESPAAGAVILSRIDPALSAAAIKSAEPEWRSEVVRRMGRLGRISPEVLEKTAESLREKARYVGKTASSELDGTGALAAILKHTDVSFGDKILGELAETDADLSRTIKERLFTLDDVVKAEDKPIQEKLRDMEVRDIAILIKGRPAGFTEKILSNISANRRAEVRAESDYIGPIPKKDAEAAIKLFMEWFRKAREEGSILMLGDELVE